MAMSADTRPVGIRVAKRYVRSVDLIRDQRDPDALEGYVVTPSVRDAATRILAGLRAVSSQRAFRVTGAYGAGKSAFGLLLARLVAEKPRRSSRAWKLIEEAGVPVPDDFSPYTPLVVVGRRANLADCIVEAVLHATEAKSDGKRLPRIAKFASELKRRRDKGVRDDSEVLELLSAYERELKTGVLLLIDEMGRFLEYSALNRREIDPSFFQQLAERAGGRHFGRLAVVGFLHHRFSDYAAGLGEWVEAEWVRSAERYEDVLFHDSTEQTAFLLANAILHEPALSGALAVQARTLYKEAVVRGVFTTAAGEMSKAGPALFPLHPAAVAALSNLASRFGQNERSVFSFIQSLEPFGFQRFIHHTGRAPDDWYRLSDLFDYVAAQGARFRSADRERRWDLVKTALSQGAGLDDAELKVLKSVGIISVLEPLPGLRADVETIAWCTGTGKSAAATALKSLVGRNLLYKRPHRGDFSLWASTSVDLDGWVQEARNSLVPARRLDALLGTLQPRNSLVAHRHYHRTGTLRAFAVLNWNGEGPVATELPPDCDGAIVVVPCYPDEREGAVIQKIAGTAAAQNALFLFCIRKVSPTELASAHELAMWRWIEQNCKELRVDDLARREVRSRIGAAEEALAAALEPFSGPATSQGETWIHRGRPVRIDDRRTLSQKLSTVCDEVFADAPTLRNELINRARLSSATAMARMKLLEAMVQSGQQSHLGLTGAPPERTMYLSLFHQSRMHRPISGDEWDFSPPDRDKANWRPTWRAIERFLKDRGTCTFEEIASELAKAPIGLRAGPALPVISAFMLHHRREIALLERNSFQPEITGAHFMRLAKTPSNFSLRYLGASRPAQQLLERLSSELVIWRGARKPDPTLKDVVEGIYRWWGTVPTFAKETTKISRTAQDVRSILKRAQEPVDFVFKQLPEACGQKNVDLRRNDPEQIRRLVEAVNEAFEEIADASKHLHSRAETALLDAFDASSLAALRTLVGAEYGPHRLQLSDYRLRAFVDRAAEAETSDHLWLDGVASLLTGKRLDSWQDDTADTFGFESKTIAGRLMRWLAHMRARKSTDAKLLTVHVVDTSGHEEMVIVRPGVLSKDSAEAVKAIRSMLTKAKDPTSVLAHVMAERLSKAASKANADG